MTVDECERRLINVLKHNPMVHHLMERMREKGCPVDVGRHFACEPCENPDLKAGFDARLNQIVVCSNRELSETEFSTCVIHEMIHLYDFCANKADFARAEHLACSEIRAYNLIDCNLNFSPLDAVFLSREKCVKRKAEDSIKAIHGGDTKNRAKIIDKVFDKCSNDLEPLGRLPRSAKCAYLFRNDF